jgi:hypothetical protein
MQRLIFSLLIFSIGLSTASAQNEQLAIETATKTFDKEVDAARKAYEEAVGKANKKLIAAYDVSIRGAMRRGGGDGLDVANKLNEDKKKLLANTDGSTDPEGKILDQLTDNTWYWHWEQFNKDLPMKFLPDGGIVDKAGAVTKNKWTAQRKWVITVNDHQFIQVSDHLFRGFHNESGRQVGMSAEPKK